MIPSYAAAAVLQQNVVFNPAGRLQVYLQKPRSTCHTVGLLRSAPTGTKRAAIIEYVPSCLFVAKHFIRRRQRRALGARRQTPRPGAYLDAHFLEPRQSFLQHVQVGRLAPSRRTHKHQTVSHDDHLIQLDYLDASEMRDRRKSVLDVHPSVLLKTLKNIRIPNSSKERMRWRH